MASPVVQSQMPVTNARRGASSKLSAFLGFGSRSSSSTSSSSKKHREPPPPVHDFGVRSNPERLPPTPVAPNPSRVYAPSVVTQSLIGIDADPFGAQRYIPASPQQATRPPVVTVSAAENFLRPDVSRVKSDSGHQQLDDVPHASPSMSPMGIFRKRTDSARSTGKPAPQQLPIGTLAATAPDSKRGSWHVRHRSSVTSIDLQLPKFSRSSRASDDFSSMLDTVANMGSPTFKPPAAGPSLSSSNPDIAGMSASRQAAHLKVQRPRTSGSTPTPLSAFHLPTPSAQKTTPPSTAVSATAPVSRSQRYTPTSTTTADARRTPKSPNTLRRLLPSTPPTHSLPPTPYLPPGAQSADRSFRDSAGSGVASSAGHAGSRALSPITSSPTGASRLPSPGIDGGRSSKVSSTESASLLFAVASPHESDEGSLHEPRRRANQPTARDLPSPRAFGSQPYPHGNLRESVASDLGPSVQPSNSLFAAVAHPLRKATSQSQLSGPSHGNRHRADNSTGSTATIKSAVIALGQTPARALDSGVKLVRKQRSMHNVAIPPVPRQVVPQPGVSGSSPPTGQNLLHSFSLKRISGGHSKNKGRNDSEISVTPPDARRPIEDVVHQRSRQASNHNTVGSSSTRPTSPAVSTFFDDSDSINGSTFSNDASFAGGFRSRTGSHVTTSGRKPADLIQHIVPPDEYVSGWVPTPGLGTDSDSSPAGSAVAGRRIPSKSMPNSPTTSSPMTPTPEAEMVLTSPVGFGGGLALAPMPPPRRQQSHSAGRARGGSLLAESAAAAGAIPGGRADTGRRPSLAAMSIRSDGGLRHMNSAGMLRSTAPRPLSKATTASAEMVQAPSPAVSPVSHVPSASGDLARKRSILKKPSFLDMDPDDDQSYRSPPRQRRVTLSSREREAAAITRARSSTSPSQHPLVPPVRQASTTPKPHTVQPPRSPGVPGLSHFPAPPPASPFAPPHADDFPSDSFLDFGRISLDTRVTDDSASASADSSSRRGADRSTMLSFDEPTPEEYLRWRQ